MKKFKEIISKFLQSNFCKEVKEILSRIIHYTFWIILILSFMLGVCGADSFMEQGYFWLCCILIFAPFLIGHIGVKYFGMGKYMNLDVEE